MQLPIPDFLNVSELAERWNCSLEIIVRYVETNVLQAAIYYQGRATIGPQNPGRTSADGVLATIRVLIPRYSASDMGIVAMARVIKVYELRVERWADPALREARQLSVEDIMEVVDSISNEPGKWFLRIHEPDPEASSDSSCWVLSRDEIKRFERENGIGVAGQKVNVEGGRQGLRHTTQLLEAQTAAISEFWEDHDPQRPPKKEFIVDWLIRKFGISQRQAEAIDLIIRPDELRRGGNRRTYDLTTGN